MKNVARIVVVVLLAVVAPAQQMAGWGTSLPEALVQAERAGRDVLVVCLDLERDAWSRALHDRVLSRASFQAKAQARYQLVALDARRDANALAGLGRLRVATCALLSPEGDVYGRLRYSVHGPAGYLRRLEAACTQRAAVITARASVAKLSDLDPKAAPEVFTEVIEALEQASRQGRGLAAAILAEGICGSASVHRDAPYFAQRGALRDRLVRAVLQAGSSCATVEQWANRSDPHNNSGLLELTMVPAMRNARSDASVRAALARLDAICALGLRDTARMKPVLERAVRLSAGRLQDHGRAARYVELIEPMLESCSDSATRKWLESVRVPPRVRPSETR